MAPPPVVLIPTRIKDRGVAALLAYNAVQSGGATDINQSPLVDNVVVASERAQQFAQSNTPLFLPLDKLDPQLSPAVRAETNFTEQQAIYKQLGDNGLLPTFFGMLAVLDFTMALDVDFTTTSASSQPTNLTFKGDAAKTYVCRVNTTASCSGVAGSKYEIGAPSDATIEGWLKSSLGTVTTLSYQRITAVNTQTAAVHTVASVEGPDEIWFRIKMVTAGDVVVRVASTTSPQTTTVFAGSSLTVHQSDIV